MTVHVESRPIHCGLNCHSLLALDLRKKLTAATGHKVPLAKILGGITGAELIEHLQKTDKESTHA